MAYCDWIKDKGYAGAAATDAWRSATKVVFETVEGESYEALSLDGIDLDDYIRRFQVLGGAKYRSETVGRCKNRIRSALDAQAYYLEHGKPPAFKRGTAKPKPDTAAAEPAKKATASRPSSGGSPVGALERDDDGRPGGLLDFAYPLSPGRMVHMQLPLQMTKREVDRALHGPPDVGGAAAVAAGDGAGRLVALAVDDRESVGSGLMCVPQIDPNGRRRCRHASA